jgi:hypothetical protein
VVSVEVLLVAAASAIYIADSAQLLYANEGLIFLVRRGWRATLGAKQFSLLGRSVHIPAPLAPQRPLFRLSWSASAASEGAAAATGAERPTAAEWAALAERFAPLALPLWVIALGLFALLPIGLFSPLGYRAVLPGLLLIYGGAVWALAWTWLRRGPLHLTRSKWSLLAFECLACPPCALNLVRKLSLGMDEALLPGRNLIQAVDTLLRASERSTFRRSLIESLEDRLDLDEGSTGAFIRQMREAIAKDSQS